MEDEDELRETLANCLASLPLSVIARELALALSDEDTEELIKLLQVDLDEVHTFIDGE